MDFSAGKLGRDAAADLEPVPDKDLVAWSPVFHPLYLYLRRNQKFLQYRGSYDFLTDKDVQKAKSGNPFYRPKRDAAYAAFESSGKRLRVILEHRLLVEKRVPVDTREERLALLASSRLAETGLPPPPFQLSSDVLRIIGPLWGRKLEVSPALICVLVDSLCDPIESATLVRAHETDVVRYVDAIRISSWSVFLALHLGMCDLAFLNRLRQSAFAEVVGIEPALPASRSLEEFELLTHARGIVERDIGASVALTELSAGGIRIVRKLERRLKRVASEHAARSELAGGAWHG